MLYMTIVIIIMAIVNWLMPKRMDRRDIIVLIISYVEIVVDLYFDKVFHLYYFGESNVLSGAVLTMKLVTAPLFGIPYLNFMPEKFSRFIPYWLFWAEWTTVHFGYLHYTGWKIWLSFLFYVLVIPIVRWFYYYIRH
ncbi:hypothetical protein ACWE42_23515 [Sutcliffiella cohnii]